MLDPADADDARDVPALGLRAEVAPITGETAGERAALVERLIELAAATAR